MKHPLTVETLTEQFGRLGGTPFELRRLEAKLDGRPMCPLSVLAPRDTRWSSNCRRPPRSRRARGRSGRGRQAQASATPFARGSRARHSTRRRYVAEVVWVARG